MKLDTKGLTRDALLPCAAYLFLRRECLHFGLSENSVSLAHAELEKKC